MRCLPILIGETSENKEACLVILADLAGLLITLEANHFVGGCSFYVYNIAYPDAVFKSYYRYLWTEVC